MSSYLVILSVGTKLPVYEIGPAIARALRRPIADVTRKLRDCRGILDLDLNRIDAEIVCSMLARHEIASNVVPAESIPELARPIALLDADPKPEGLEVQRTAGPGDTGILPWESIRIAAVGTVTFAPAVGPVYLTGDTMTAGDFPQDDGMGGDLFGLAFGFSGVPVSNAPRSYTLKEKRRKSPSPESVSCLDLVLTDSATRYRIVASRFVYDYLGDRMKLRSRDNFHSLIEDIAGFSPEILLSSTTLSYLDNPKSREHRFDSREEFEAYVRWLTAWDSVFG